MIEVSRERPYFCLGAGKKPRGPRALWAVFAVMAMQLWRPR